MTTEQRLERLERQNRWMRRIGAVAVAVAAAVFLIGQGKDKELPDLEVRSVTVKDADGKVRAFLGLDGDGSPYLRVGSRFDHHADLRPKELMIAGAKYPRVILGVHRVVAGEVLYFADEKGTLRAKLDTHANGPAALRLYDKDRQERALLCTGIKGLPSPLTLYDAKGNVIWKAPSGRRRSPVEAALAQCKRLYDAAMVWKTINRKPPDSLDEMVAPLRKGDDENFLDSVPDDPWDHPYVLKREGTKIRIYSWGEDGKEGTDDDIVFPEDK